MTVIPSKYALIDWQIDFEPSLLGRGPGHIFIMQIVQICTVVKNKQTRKETLLTIYY